MYNTTVIYFMSIALIAYGGIFIIKNFLVNYKASDNGFKNIAAILLMLFAVMSAMAAAGDAWSIEGLMEELKYNMNIDAEIRQLMERNIAGYRRESITCIISGYIMFIASYFMYKNIKQELSRNLNRPKSNWDWSKIRR